MPGLSDSYNIYMKKRALENSYYTPDPSQSNDDDFSLPPIAPAQTGGFLDGLRNLGLGVLGVVPKTIGAVGGMVNAITPDSWNYKGQHAGDLLSEAAARTIGLPSFYTQALPSMSADNMKKYAAEGAHAFYQDEPKLAGADTSSTAYQVGDVVGNLAGMLVGGGAIGSGLKITSALGKIGLGAALGGSNQAINDWRAYERPEEGQPKLSMGEYLARVGAGTATGGLTGLISPMTSRFMNAAANMAIGGGTSLAIDGAQLYASDDPTRRQQIGDSMLQNAVRGAVVQMGIGYLTHNLPSDFKSLVGMVKQANETPIATPIQQQPQANVAGITSMPIAQEVPRAVSFVANLQHSNPEAYSFLQQKTGTIGLDPQAMVDKIASEAQATDHGTGGGLAWFDSVFGKGWQSQVQETPNDGTQRSIAPATGAPQEAQPNPIGQGTPAQGSEGIQPLDIGNGDQGQPVIHPVESAPRPNVQEAQFTEPQAGSHAEPTTAGPEIPPAQEVNQPITGEPHATQEGQQPEVDQQQHQNGNEGGQTPEASNSDSNVRGGEGATPSEEDQARQTNQPLTEGEPNGQEKGLQAQEIEQNLPEHPIKGEPNVQPRTENNTNGEPGQRDAGHGDEYALQKVNEVDAENKALARSEAKTRVQKDEEVVQSIMDKTGAPADKVLRAIHNIDTPGYKMSARMRDAVQEALDATTHRPLAKILNDVAHEFSKPKEGAGVDVQDKRYRQRNLRADQMYALLNGDVVTLPADKNGNPNLSQLRLDRAVPRVIDELNKYTGADINLKEMWKQAHESGSTAMFTYEHDGKPIATVTAKPGIGLQLELEPEVQLANKMFERAATGVLDQTRIANGTQLGHGTPVETPHEDTGGEQTGFNQGTDRYIRRYESEYKTQDDERAARYIDDQVKVGKVSPEDAERLKAVLREPKSDITQADVVEDNPPTYEKLSRDMIDYAKEGGETVSQKEIDRDVAHYEKTQDYDALVRLTEDKPYSADDIVNLYHVKANQEAAISALHDTVAETTKVMQAAEEPTGVKVRGQNMRQRKNRSAEPPDPDVVNMMSDAPPNLSDAEWLRVFREKANANEEVKKSPYGLPRGANAAHAEIDNAVNTGLILPEHGELAKWLLDKNPSLARDMSLLIGKSAPGAAGSYNILHALVELSAGKTDSITLAHEILHHTERLLPDDIRQAVIHDWLNAVNKEIDSATPERANALIAQVRGYAEKRGGYDDLVNSAYDNGTLNVDRDYRLASPSEYWAEYGSDYINVRKNSGVWQRAKMWYNEFYQNLRRFFGKDYDSLAAGMRQVFKSKGDLTGGNLNATAYPDRYEGVKFFDRAENQAKIDKAIANAAFSGQSDESLKKMGTALTGQGLQADHAIEFSRAAGTSGMEDPQTKRKIIGMGSDMVPGARGGIFQWIRTRPVFYDERTLKTNLDNYYSGHNISEAEKAKAIAKSLANNRELNNIPWPVALQNAMVNVKLLPKNEYTAALDQAIFHGKALGEKQSAASRQFKKSFNALPKEMKGKVGYEYWLEDHDKTEIINKHIPEGAGIRDYINSQPMDEEIAQWDKDRRDYLAQNSPDVLEQLDRLKSIRESHIRATVESMAIEHLGTSIKKGTLEWSQQARNLADLTDKAAVALHKAIHDPLPDDQEIANRQAALNQVSMNAQQALSVRNQFLYFENLRELSVKRGYMPRFFDTKSAKYTVRVKQTATDVGQRLAFRSEKDMNNYLDTLNRPLTGKELDAMPSGTPTTHPITGEQLGTLADVYRAQGGKVEIIKSRAETQAPDLAVNPGVIRDMISEIANSSGPNGEVPSEKAKAFLKAYGGDLANLVDAKTLSEIGLTSPTTGDITLTNVKQLRKLINAIATPNFINTMEHRTGVEGYAPSPVDLITGRENPDYHRQMGDWVSSGIDHLIRENQARIENATILREANSQMADLASKGIAPRYQKFLANFMSGVRWVDPVGEKYPTLKKLDTAISTWNVFRFMLFSTTSPIKNFSLGYVNAGVEAAAMKGGVKNIRSLFYGDKEYIKALKFAIGDKQFSDFLKDPSTISTLSDGINYALKSGTDLEKVALLLRNTGVGDAEWTKSIDRTLPDWLAHPDNIQSTPARALAKSFSWLEKWGMSPTKYVEDHNRLSSALAGAYLHLANNPGDIDGAFESAVRFANNSQGNFRGYAKSSLERTLIGTPGGRSLLTLATAGLRASEQIGAHIMAAADRPQYVKLWAPVLAGALGLIATTGMKGGPISGDAYNLIKWFGNNINGDDKDLRAVKENWDEAMRRHFVNTMQKNGFDPKASGNYFDAVLYGMMTKISGHNLAAENTLSGLVVDNIVKSSIDDVNGFLTHMKTDDAHQLFSHSLKLINTQAGRIDRNLSDYLAGRQRDVTGKPVGEPVSAGEAIAGTLLGSKWKDMEGMLSHKEGGGKVYSDSDASKYVSALDRLDGVKFDNIHYGYFKERVPGLAEPQYSPARVNKFHDLVLNHYDQTKQEEHNAVQQFTEALKDPRYAQKIYEVALGGQTSGRGGTEIESANKEVINKVKSYYAAQAVRRAFQDVGVRPPAYDYNNKPFGAALKYMGGVDKRAKKKAVSEKARSKYASPTVDADEEN